MKYIEKYLEEVKHKKIMVKIKELGVFKDNYKENIYTPIDFDWSGRQLWLNSIQCCDYKEIGSSNYSYDQIGTYNFIFNINAGDNNHSLKGGEYYVFIIQIEITEWYRDEHNIANDILNALNTYPIIDIMEVLAAFKQRKYYRLGNKYCITNETSN